MRSLGALGMSIGTSLAIEQSDAASQIRMSDVILFNIWTLIRNARDAYESKEEKEKVTADQLVDDVISDLKNLSRWLEEVRLTKPIKLVVYYPTYFSIALRFPLAELKKPKTAIQIAYDKLSNKVASALYKRYEKLISKTDMGMPSFNGKGIVLTHHVVDLAMFDAPARLTLLESYTGRLKPYTQWYTKLTGGDKLFNMPFNKLTIQVFGDESTNFRSSSHKIKELVKKLATDWGWTPATTVLRIRVHIRSMENGIDRHALLKML